MSALRWLSTLFIALAVVAGGMLWLQRQSAAQLRDEIGLLRQDNARIARLRDENARLAAQVSAAELDRLRSDRAAVIQFRGEIEKLKQGLDERERAMKLFPAAKMVAAEPEPAPTERMWPAAKLKNAGAATPVAALETVLWSASTGHVDELVKLLMFDNAASARARGMFEALSTAEQKNYGGPLRMVAALMAKDLPSGDARVLEVKSTDPARVSVQLDVELHSADGDTHTARFEFKKVENRWGLWVPGKVVDEITVEAGSPPTK